jgi:tRNA pseudouridine38-40 synthase
MADPRKIKLVLAYDGTQYHGWQYQKNGLSIQAVLEERIHVITRERARVIASGRTDAGVHALGQVCHFETRSRLEPDELKKGLNSLLPPDILVRRAEAVPASFHARYSARSKVYEYRILNSTDPDVFLRNYAWHISRPLDLKALGACLSIVQGEHDFTSFRSSGSNNRNPIRHILRTELKGPENGIIRLVFEASGFLRHMVRNMTGTLVEVGMGKISVRGFLEILLARDRRKAGRKAPSEGLFLVRVIYEDEAPADY